MLSYPIRNNKEDEAYWAIILEDNWVSSAVWVIKDGNAQIIFQGEGIRYEENLTEAVDTSLSTVAQNLPEDIKEPSKTVFGLPSNWVSEGNIKEEKLAVLKKICEDLSLAPSGFVVLSEAIAHFIKSEEGSDFSGIVVGVNDSELDVSIFNLGKLIGTTLVARSVVPSDDLIEGLSRLSSLINLYPSRIVIFNQKQDELASIKQSFEDVSWGKVGEASFAHPPVIEIFDPYKKLAAVCLAGGAELGAVGADIVKTDDLIVNIEEPAGVTPEDLGFKVEPTEQSEKPSLKIPQVPSLPKINFNLNLAFLRSQRSLVVILASIATFIVSGFSVWWFLPKADVVVFVSPKKIEESFEMDIENNLDLKEVGAEQAGEKTKQTTGTKTVGDKAKGSVKIQNGTAFPINLPAGTQLVSTSDLKFQTTKQASVSGAISPSNPGTATIDLEAVNIGSEYNLSKDEVFKVGNYPKAEVDAVAVDNFSGGSSRQIPAVSKDDIDTLFDELKEELLEKAKADLLREISSDEVLIEDSLEESVVEDDYSNKLGDEATSIKLSLKIKVVAKVAKKGELTKLAREKLEGSVPSGFVLKDDQIEYNFDLNGDGQDKLKVSANLIPDISTEEIAKKISGKYPKVAEEYLSTIPGFVSAEFRLRPRFPEKIKTLPHILKNIDIVISAQK